MVVIDVVDRVGVIESIGVFLVVFGVYGAFVLTFRVAYARGRARGIQEAIWEIDQTLERGYVTFPLAAVVRRLECEQKRAKKEVF